MTIKNKLIWSFSGLTAILIVLGVIAWLYIGWLGKNIGEIVDWKVPAAKLSVDVHAGAYDASIEQLNYLLYEKPETHQKANQVLAAMEKSLDKIDTLARQYNDQGLLKKSAVVRKNVADFKQLFDQGVRNLQQNKQAVAVMVKNGREVLAQANAFARKQEREYAQLLKMDALQSQLNDKVQKYILVNRIKALALTIIQHEKQERLYKDRRFYQQMQKELPELMQLYEQLKQLTRNREELKQIQIAKQATNNYQKAAKQWIANDDQLKVIVSNMNKIAAQARAQAAAAEQDGWRKVDEIGAQTVSLISQANLMIVIAVLFGAILAGVIAVTLTRAIVTAIQALSAFSNRFGQGDLTARVNVDSKDEIGDVAKDLEKAAGNLRQILQKVYENALSLSSHSTALNQSVEASAKSIEMQKQQTEQVATAMTEMTSTVDEVSKNASQAADAANEADRQAIEGNQVVSQAVSSIKQLANEIDRATEVINQLESDVGNISSILDVIRNVSEQTNLLALNAAIEAARAGEHGRGFAVVADEVRTLASRTQTSTDEIQAMIEKLQSGAKKAVGAMKASHKMTEDSVQKATESGESLNAITSSVTTISDMNSQIAEAAGEQRMVAEEINQNIVTINKVAVESAEVSEKTISASRELNQLAEEMKGAVTQFKV